MVVVFMDGFDFVFEFLFVDDFCGVGVGSWCCFYDGLLVKGLRGIGMMGWRIKRELELRNEVFRVI